MIAPSNRIWIVLLLAGLMLSFVHADAQQESQKGAPNPYLKGTEGYYKGPRGLTSYQPIAIDQPFAARAKAAIKRFDEGAWKRDLTLPSSSARKTTVISKLSSVAQELPDSATFPFIKSAAIRKDLPSSIRN
jgi:hypothetical protein